ncbi:MAG: polysaccharide lyase family 7 protein [Collimonas sp.]|uniref:polysaccharide lyase family 7 protein n=1 Tax=Collimonas sp. TaxID=1963772 RepID=UPI0032631CF9
MPGPRPANTDSADGSLIMMDPRTGWTTSGSLHPRTEMRENATWAATGTNLLNATVKVSQVPDHTTIGQIFQGSGPSKPLCELQITSKGKIQLLLENTNQGGSANIYPVTSVPPGTKFDYQLQLLNRTVTVTANGVVKAFTIDASFAGEKFYFKAGDYDQTAVSGTPDTNAGTIVHFYALNITHE